MIGIELFAGAGGLSLGAVQAGVDVRIAVEMQKEACETYSRNHPTTTLIRKDVREVASFEGLTRRDEELVLFGGPPCQGFSTSNQRTRGPGNERNWLFREFLRVTGLLQPQWVVFENVAGILHTSGGLFVEEMRRGLQTLGYRCSPNMLLRADRYGLPQRRTRFFMVASRDSQPPQCVPPPLPLRTPTVEDAIADLPILANGADTDRLPYGCRPTAAYAAALRGRLRSCTGHLVTRNANEIVERYRFIPQGGNWRDIPADLMLTYADRSRCHTGIYRRLRRDEPSIVIGNYRKNMLLHPTQDRGLSVREAARLQSFPDSYEFRGSIGRQQQQVGNAVPPLLAAVVFRAIVPPRSDRHA